MNPYTAVTTLIALSLLWNQPVQSSLEKRVVDDTKRTLASELDAELPRLPFADWLGRVVGPDTEIVWQLSECGELVEAAPNGANDPRACVEANTILTDGRRLIVMVAVGTFKKGMTGPPAFQFGVIDQKGELRQIRRLRDLHDLLLNPDKLPKRSAVKLPDLNMADISQVPNNTYVSVTPTLGGEDVGRLAPIEDPEPPPTRPPQEAERQTPQGGVRQGAPKVKPQATYPRNNNAKRFNASGPVEVQVTISVTGRVTDAKAVKGHPLLREAAVDAARRWEFEPTTNNGVPMETQLTLTFVFTVPPQ